VSHDFLIDGIEDFESVFSCMDEVQFFQDREMVGCEVLRKIEVLPYLADAAFTFLEQAEDTKPILIADRTQESGVLYESGSCTLCLAGRKIHNGCAKLYQ